MKANWKLWLAGAVVLVTLAFCIHRFRSSFQDKAPDWLRLRQIDSPSLPAAIVERFVEFRKSLESEAKTAGLSVDSVQMVELTPDGKDIRLWAFEKFTNPGPTPLANFEVPHWLTDDRPVGYYTVDGPPLHFMLKHHPSRPNVAFGEIILDKPLAPGETRLVLNIEHIPNNLKPDAAGEMTYRFTKLRGADTSVQGVCFLLPSNYAVQRYAPKAGASEYTGNMPMISWINTRLEAVSLPPSVTFKHL
jgi:hypothetical protein